MNSSREIGRAADEVVSPRMSIPEDAELRVRLDVDPEGNRAVQADLIETAESRNELVSLIATGGITYNETELQVDEERSRPGNIAYIENESNEFIGDNLFYDVGASLVTVNGSPRFPCFFNGVRVDKIEYDPQTEKVKADMSSSPSPMTPSSKKKSKRR